MAKREGNTTALVLGSGMIGRAMALDLAREPDWSVSIADIDRDNLAAAAANATAQAPITTVHADLADMTALGKLVQPFDVILGALPSRFGFEALRTITRAGKKYADICFMPQDQLSLNDVAVNAGATAVVDCGVSPGLSNLFVGHACHELDDATDAVIYVGGLPFKRDWPFQYRAPFAPGDVIEEYTRPARFISHGQVCVRPALSDPELIEFPRVGTLEAFNTDGLRTLLTTCPIPNMREKTLRYPGHIELMRVLRETGFFSTEPRDLGDAKVAPLDITARLLTDSWKFRPGETEFTALRVEVEGLKEGRRMRMRYDLFDTTDPVSGVQSMARTTAFPNTAMARLLARGVFDKPGVFAPEQLASHPAVFNALIDDLAARGVDVAIRRDEVDAANPPTAI